MIKFKIKETYLILLIVLSLVSLGIYSTYALFTATTTINDAVGITATLDIGKSISEYEIVTVNSNETKLIELNITNSSSNTIYYGAWYKIAEGNSENVDIGLYTEKNSNTSSGSLSASSNTNLLVGITNDNSSTITVYLGVKGSTTNELNLGSDKTLLPNGFTEGLLVTDEVLEEHQTTVTTTESVNKTYSCTSSVQNDTLSKGTYTLEVWGAQGGNYNSSYVGGKGGYSKGTLTLTGDTNIYVYVGCQGSGHNSTVGGVSNGGFNGGGSAKTVYYSNTYSYVTGGGGATDIRLNSDSLYSRVIVAGGGSGSSNKGSGYYGGGTTAGYGVSGYGATSTSAGTNGSFGVGASANPSSTNYKYASPGGGGGFYGGGSSGTQRSDSTDYRTYTGGGSGYVYTSSTASNYPSGCLLNSNYYLTNASTSAGNTSFTDYNGSSVTGHSGNGYAKITGNKIVEVPGYTIPQLKGLTTLNITPGTTADLTSGLELVCENNQTTGCSIKSTSITDTSTLELGTYTVTYKVIGTDNKKYLFNRTINVVEYLNLDNSGANLPDLVQGLIPVMYNETTSSWVVADKDNSDETYQWYDYNNKKWANAVLVTETKRNSLNKDSNGNYVAGQTIGDTYDDGTLAFYVWIPRYKYKVWNINKVIGTDSYDARTTGIDIVFESEKEKSGTISCTYDFSVTEGNNLSESCTGSNGDYYTHPAFTFGSNEVRGFWIGKYEVSSSNPETGESYGGGESNNLTIRILPNVTSWRYNTVSNFNTVIQNTQISNNIYGLNTSRTVADSHMLTNYEWGAVAYLTNSKYGKCTNNSCSEVAKNSYGEINYYTTMTGCGPTSSESISYNTTCNTYNTTLGMTASTTGNITGLYDISGGAYEYVMGNMSSESGNYTFYPSSSSFASSWYNDSTAKYITTYAYDSSYEANQTTYNRGRLGDATGEVVLTSSYNGGWYGDYAVFPYSSGAWFGRGGVFDDGYNAGPFYFYAVTGNSKSTYSSRAALIGLSS